MVPRKHSPASTKNASAGTNENASVPRRAAQPVGEGPHPSAEPQGDGNRRDREHGGVFRQEEERPAKPAVLGVEAGDQFRLRFRQIERRAIGLRHHGNGKDPECDESQRKELEDEPGLLGVLRFDNADHAQRAGAGLKAGHEHGRDDRQPHGDFVRHHLRAGTQRTHQRVVRVRRPARHDDAQHAQRRNRPA